MPAPLPRTPGRAQQIARGVAWGLGATAAVGAGCLTYAAAYEVKAFRLRRVSVPVLPRGAEPIRVLHLSDIHMTPGDTAKQRWLGELAGLEPDLVIDTGDNLAHLDAVPYVSGALGRLLDLPGVYVWGSNDYFVPTFKNPFSYLISPSNGRRPSKRALPWEDLAADFAAAGWHDLTHTDLTLEIQGVRIGFRGTDDAHLGRDRYAEVAGPVDRSAVDVSLAVTHAPYRRVIDAMAADQHDLIVAGHTHGGQVCIPFYGALVTNCDLDTRRVKGLSMHSAGGHTSFLHVSAGCGTSPYAKVRFACPPEATLMTLVSRDGDGVGPLGRLDASAAAI